MILPPLQDWLDLLKGARYEIVGGLVVAVIVFLVTAFRGRIFGSRGSSLPSAPPQEVVVKIESVPPAAPAATKETASTPGPAVQSFIPRPPLAGFVARRDENGRDIVDRLKAELSPEKEQVIVLWGAGGVGKTTLAAETARAMRNVFPGGIVWMTADGRSDFSLSTLLDHIATHLGRADLKQLASDPKDEQVHQALSSAPATLLVLDNFETISPEEQKRCADWLANRAFCPALITSRDEVVHARPVHVLAMSLSEALEFLGRLISQSPRPQAFEHLDHNKIVQAADRIPLVLKWIVQQINTARQPQSVLDELSRGEGDAATRVFDRSVNLPQVAEDGRATLLAVSLFVPDASREALAAVSGFGTDLKRLDRAVKQLVELWLIQTSANNERLSVAGLTRELAQVRLDSSERSQDYRRRFVAFFDQYVKTQLEGKANYDALEREKENILRAIQLSFELKDWASVQSFTLPIAQPADGWLSVRGHWADAVKANELALEAARNQGSRSSIADFAHNLAVMYSLRGQWTEARTLYNESLQIKKETGNKKSMAGTVYQLAMLDHHQGNFAQARQRYDESLQIRREIADKRGISHCLHQLAMLAHQQNDYKEAKRLYDESLEIKRELGHKQGIATTLHQLGMLAHDQGGYVEARKLYDESLTIVRERSEERLIVRSLHQLGMLAQDEGDLERAQALYNESLEIKKRLGDQDGIASTLFQLGRVAEDQGNLNEAARLFREALNIFEKLKSMDTDIAHRGLERVQGKTK